MNVCPKCSAAVASDARFCTSCGTSIEDAEEPSRSPRWGRYVGIGLAVAGLIALGIVGLLFVRGSEGIAGGASSPEAAVTEFVNGLSDDDVLRAVTYVAPDEIDGLAAVIDDAAAYLGSEEIDAWHQGEGIDLELELTDVTSRAEGDNAAIVEFELAGSIDNTTLTGPIAELLPTTWSFAEDGWRLGYDDDRSPFQIVTVQLDGSWFVSPMLSVGQAVVELADMAGGDYQLIGRDRPSGATSPEAAVEDLLSAAADFDISEVAANLGGGEGRFATVFADAIDDLLSEIPPDVAADVDVRATEGDDGQVVVDEVTVNASSQYGAIEVEVRGDCIRTSSFDEGDSERFCLLDGLPFVGEVSQDLILDTVEDDGRYRVRLVPSAMRVAGELVDALDRQTVMHLLNIEYADDAEIVVPDSDTEIDYDGRWFAVYEFEATPGTAYRISSEENSDVDVYVERPDGTWEERSSRLELDDPTTVRVLAESEIDFDDCAVLACFPSGRGSDTLRVATVARQNVEFPAIISGELGPGDEILFDFDVSAPQTLRIDIEGTDVGWSFVAGDYGYLGPDLYDLQPGPYTISVSSFGGSASSFRLVPVEASGVGFNGSSTMSVDLTAGPVGVQLSLLPGTWSVVATPLDGQDIAMRIDSLGCYADVLFAGDAESCTVEVAAATTVAVDVLPYSSNNHYGQVVLEVF